MPGKYILLVSYVGYDSKNIADVEIIKGETTTLNITLTPGKKFQSNCSCCNEHECQKRKPECITDYKKECIGSI
jgi:hypothetical protein